MDVQSYAALRMDDAGAHAVEDALTPEAALHIRVNDEAFTTTMRTPGDDHVLARGLLFTEGVISSGAAPMTFRETLDPESGIVACLDVAVDPQTLAKPIAGRRSLLSTAACGVCGTRDPGDISVFGEPIALRPDAVLPYERITFYFAEMSRAQRMFAQTGGAHAAAIFDSSGAMLTIQEDIGRHNAVDKAVGSLLAENRLHVAQTLAVSGRVSYEIVYKAYRAGIPILIAVGAASSLAVETSSRLGITLAAFCRDGRATVYTHSERISMAKMTERAIHG